MVFILIISLLIYLSMIFSVEHRTAFASIGLGIILLYGTITNTYNASEVFASFPFEIITLILALGLFSKVFENNSFFKYIADKFFQLSKGN